MMFVFLLSMLLLIPLTMIGFGALWKNHAPKDINVLYGYRTSRSMKNKETWEFAHKYCGRLWLVSGIILMISSLIAMFVFKHQAESASIWIIWGQILILIISIFPTELALKRNFDEQGNLRK